MVVIATPTRGEILGRTVSDLIQLIKYSPETEWMLAEGTYLNNLRTILVDTAVAAKASHILFIDSDMRFPKDSLERLLKHKKEIVGANYRQRTQDQFCASKGDKFISSGGKKGLEEVDSVGFGVLLVDTTVFTSPLRAVPKDAFAMPFDTSQGKFVGEDVYFCTMAKDRGFKVWIDHDLSQEVRHTGMVEFSV